MDSGIYDRTVTPPRHLTQTPRPDRNPVWTSDKESIIETRIPVPPDTDGPQPIMTPPESQLQDPFQTTSEVRKRVYISPRNTTQRTSIPSSSHPLHFDRKNGKSYTEKNKYKLQIYDSREWNKGIENTSIKIHTYQQV